MIYLVVSMLWAANVNMVFVIFRASEFCSLYGPTVRALNAESPNKKHFEHFQKVSWSRNRLVSYGFAPYFACAQLYTFAMVSACAPAP